MQGRTCSIKGVFTFSQQSFFVKFTFKKLNYHGAAAPPPHIFGSMYKIEMK